MSGGANRARFPSGARSSSDSAVSCGAAAVEAAGQVRAQVLLLGVTGVHHEAGLITGDPDEAATKRALSRRAANTWVLASAEEIGAASAFTVLGCTEVTGVITDAPDTHPTLDHLRDTGVTIHQAP